MGFINILNWLVDVVMLFYLFRKADNNDNSDIKNKILTAVSIILMLPLYYPVPAISNIILRCVYRIATYCMWLYIYKGFSPMSSIYWGTFAWLAFSCANCIFLTPPLVGLKRDLALMITNQLGKVLIGRASEYLLEFIVMFIFSATVHFNTVTRIVAERIAVVLSLTLCNLYIKQSLHSMADTPGTNFAIELTVYPILIQLLVIILPISVERYVFLREKGEHQRREDIIRQRTYDNAIAQQQADQDVRQLHHDMKNHLIAISSMVKDDNTNAEEYIEKLIEKIAPYELHANTGNKVLDGLLSEKIYLSKSLGIEVSADIDFSEGNFIDDMDICTIFGNALDNAIEACRKIENPSERFIQIKCNSVNNQFVIRFTNPFEGKIVENKGFPISTKGSNNHGIGMSSMKNVIKKLNGDMAYFVDEYHNFVLTFMIPVPQGTR